ncbi:MAG: ATP-binding protein [Gaiellaceae bacterium]
MPVPPTPLVGRDRDVENLLLLLRRDDVAVVTLTGAGGSGKSRLAIQVGAHLIGDYPDGVWFVPLASLADPGLVVAEIAKTLGLREGGGTTFGEVLGQHLRVRRLLLLLDNLEHLLPVVASTLADLAAASPGLVLLATSREALRIAAEHEFPVPPLAPADASELFAARAKSVRPDFELSEERLVVGAICERLDRLPLAIELAAARVRVLPPTKLLERLEKRLPLLAGGPRDAPARHRTLRATITWSHDLLEEKELRLFARLSVFARGCTLEAAEAVCTADVETLGALIEKNLIHRDEGGEAEPRYAMLETIREFALERLDETSECEEIQRRHAEYFIAFALIAEPHLSGREQRRWLDRLEADNDNFRVAHRWELDHGDPELALRLARALVLFWTKRGHVREGRDILLASLERASPRPSPTRAGALDWAGYLCRELGEHSRGLSEQAVVCAREANAPAVLALALAHNVETDRPIDELVKHLEEAKALAEKAGDPLVLGIALNNLASVTVELERAFALFEESYRVRAGMGDLAWMALSLSNLAETALDLGEITQAREFGTKALELSREAGDRRETVFAATALAWIALDQNRIEDASGLFTEALALAHEISNRTQAREALQGLATVAAATGDGLLAAQLAAAAEPTVPGNSGPPGPARRALTDRLFTTVRAETDPAQWEDAWRQGTAMSLAQATAKILETTSGRRT